MSAADTRLALPPAAVGRTAVERRTARRDASPHRTAVERRSYQADFAKCGGGRLVVEAPPGWRLSQLVRRQDGGFPCGRDGARPSQGGSAGRLAPPGDDGHAGRVTLPQRARYPAYPILPPPQITPVLLYYAHRKSRRKFNRSEAYEEVM